MSCDGCWHRRDVVRQAPYEWLLVCAVDDAVCRIETDLVIDERRAGCWRTLRRRRRARKTG